MKLIFCTSTLQDNQLQNIDFLLFFVVKPADVLRPALNGRGEVFLGYKASPRPLFHGEL